jgi:hypothetical protein
LTGCGLECEQVIQREKGVERSRIRDDRHRALETLRMFSVGL